MEPQSKSIEEQFDQQAEKSRFQQEDINLIYDQQSNSDQDVIQKSEVQQKDVKKILLNNQQEDEVELNSNSSDEKNDIITEEFQKKTKVPFQRPKKRFKAKNGEEYQKRQKPKTFQLSQSQIIEKSQKQSIPKHKHNKHYQFIVDRKIQTTLGKLFFKDITTHFKNQDVKIWLRIVDMDKIHIYYSDEKYLQEAKQYLDELSNQINYTELTINPRQYSQIFEENLFRMSRSLRENLLNNNLTTLKVDRKQSAKSIKCPYQYYLSGRATVQQIRIKKQQIEKLHFYDIFLKGIRSTHSIRQIIKLILKQKQTQIFKEKNKYLEIQLLRQLDKVKEKQKQKKSKNQYFNTNRQKQKALIRILITAPSMIMDLNICAIQIKEFLKNKFAVMFLIASIDENSKTPMIQLQQEQIAIKSLKDSKLKCIYYMILWSREFKIGNEAKRLKKIFDERQIKITGFRLFEHFAQEYQIKALQAYYKVKKFPIVNPYSWTIEKTEENEIDLVEFLEKKRYC